MADIRNFFIKKMPSKQHDPRCVDEKENMLTVVTPLFTGRGGYDRNNDRHNSGVGNDIITIMDDKNNVDPGGDGTSGSIGSGRQPSECIGRETQMIDREDAADVVTLAAASSNKTTTMTKHAKQHDPCLYDKKENKRPKTIVTPNDHVHLTVINDRMPSAKSCFDGNDKRNKSKDSGYYLAMK
jgi:hypothetical protein